MSAVDDDTCAPSRGSFRRDRVARVLTATVAVVVACVFLTGTWLQASVAHRSGPPVVGVPSDPVSVRCCPLFPLVDRTTGDVFVAAWGSDNLSMIPNEWGAQALTIPLAGIPSSTVFDPVSNQIYAIIQNTTNVGQISVNVTVVSAESDSVVATFPVGNLWSWIPPSIAVDRDSGRVFVVSVSVNNTTTIQAFSDNPNALSWTTQIPGASWAMVVDPLNGNLYALGGSASYGVAILNETSGAFVANVSVGSYPELGAFDSKTNDIYVLNVGSDNISVISGQTNTVVGSDAVAGSPFAITVDQETGNVFVGSNLFNQSRSPQFYNGTEVMISGSNLTESGANYFGDDYFGFLVDTPSGVLCDTNQNLTLINATSNAEVESIPLPQYPYLASYDPVNGWVYVSSYQPGFVTALRGIPVPPTVRAPLVLGLTFAEALLGESVAVGVALAAGAGALDQGSAVGKVRTGGWRDHRPRPR